MRKTFSLLLASTALISVAGIGQAFAQTITTNSLFIDAANNGTVKTLAISQDSTVHQNDISLAGNGAQPFSAIGKWDSISITQTGASGTTGSNILKGVGIGTRASGMSSFTGYYSTTKSATKDNVHTLATTVSGGDANIDITMVQDGTAGHNVVTDSLTATGGLEYKLSVNGSGNTLVNNLSGSAVTLRDINMGNSPLAITGNSNAITNTITASSTINVGQTVTGDSNTINNVIHSGTAVSVFQQIIGKSNTVNTVSSAAAPTSPFQSNGVYEYINIAGNGNTVNNYSPTSGAGSRDITVDLPTGNNVVTNTFDGSTGAETSILTVFGQSSYINYAYNATPGNGTTYSNTYLSGVAGSSGTPGFVQVNQAAPNTSSRLNIDGNAFYMDKTLQTNTLGAYVNQASSGATSSVYVKAAADGYTVSIRQ